MQLRTAFGCFAIALAAVLSACSGAGVPGAADVPDLIAEAAGTKPQPRRDSEARRAVRASFRAMLLVDSIHVAEVGRRFQRHELTDSYLLRDESFVGGKWPKQTALLLREVQRADVEYLAAMQSFSTVLDRRLAETDLSDASRDIIAIDLLVELGIARELTGRRRKRVFDYDRYMAILSAAPIGTASACGAVRLHLNQT